MFNFHAQTGLRTKIGVLMSPVGLPYQPIHHSTLRKSCPCSEGSCDVTKMPFAYGLAKASFGVLMILETWLRSWGPIAKIIFIEADCFGSLVIDCARLLG